MAQAQAQAQPSAQQNLNPEDLKDGTWFMIYPIYLDSNRTLAQGRKVPKEHACIAPIPQEIAEVCTHFKLPWVYEKLKAHPRDPITRMGRIRVKIKSTRDGPPMNAEVPTKKELLRKMGSMIPSLPSRKQRKIVIPGQEEIEIPGDAGGSGMTKKDLKKAAKKKKKGKR
mmetsp:Transcript_7895/g.10015  ORF Transcript_7895/g.10015 Transcript_7895/m.10015 type:complete len:169 (-) Transcript_7895:142-648(-)|eukprot:CAMPEP_0204829894 /NCGR_PEP_ID=MMETSP1346-20131115/8212_1 /ASSEMBLY_ACC=CAM_ASM_000771 /TAXON_ID=215587 /ORGANISM="Aplanochytrium stocchinoi, Strain GSBS06" /LENGTH=168 /DNA_ID=CAMNT_0051959985 /DNA_START=243 /DNA_END=749 /DNA_ORIENTATION=-